MNKTRNIVMFCISFAVVLSLGANGMTGTGNNSISLIFNHTFSLQEVAWENLFQLLSPDLTKYLEVLGLSGIGNITTHLTGPPENLIISGELDLERSGIHYKNVFVKPEAIKAMLTFQVKKASDLIEFASLNFSLGNLELKTIGKIVNLKQLHINLVFDMNRLNIQEFFTYFPLLEASLPEKLTLSGSGKLHLALNGTLDELVMSGNIDMSQGEIAVKDVFSKQKDIPGSIEFDTTIRKTTVEIKHVRVNMNDVCLDISKMMAESQHDAEDTVDKEMVFYPEGLVLLPVPAGKYQISDYLWPYLRYLEKRTIVIAKPFSIQAGEVTVGDFRRYFNSLDKEAQEQIGTKWDTGSGQKPLENISWQEASNYAAWLSKQTNLDLRLPTLYQWASACVKYPDPQLVLNTQNGQPLSVSRKERRIDHLLGNLREWSKDSCGDGKYHLLGENYMTDPNDPGAVGKANCAKGSKWSGVGFRLVKTDE